MTGGAAGHTGGGPQAEGEEVRRVLLGAEGHQGASGMKGRSAKEQSQGGGIDQAACVVGQPCAPPMEEGSDLMGLTPFQAHELLVEVYGNHLHHNNGNHLYGGVTNDTLWQRRWQRLAAQSTRW